MPRSAMGANARNGDITAKVPSQVKTQITSQNARKPKSGPNVRNTDTAVPKSLCGSLRSPHNAQRRSRLPPAPLLRTTSSSLRVSARELSEMRSCAPARLRWTRGSLGSGVLKLRVPKASPVMLVRLRKVPNPPGHKRGLGSQRSCVLHDTRREVCPTTGRENDSPASGYTQ